MIEHHENGTVFQQMHRQHSKWSCDPQWQGDLMLEYFYHHSNNKFTDEDDSDYGDDFELESGSGFRDVRIKVPSLRMDAILKAGLNMSRNKVETAFYASKIRINGDKVLKKSNQVHEGDELDVVQNVSSVNPDLLNISRIVLLRVGKYDEDSDKFEIKLRKYPQLLVPKYGGFPSEEDDPNVPH
ncbi:mitochondrial transcription rescue factor 1 isoform X2 [Panulirus ornatus]|uniref:mitochondrial transcription rescue factor 1 isoform X2 n=1 Tax=Panulirus ornatus TaxID=150431 RepID=UPI003A846EC1